MHKTVDETKTPAQMSIQELHDFLYERICREEGCYNRPAQGIVICEGCAYGLPSRADPKLVTAKKRLERLEA